jgi:hypothetical protein
MKQNRISNKNFEKAVFLRRRLALYNQERVVAFLLTRNT